MRGLLSTAGWFGLLVAACSPAPAPLVAPSAPSAPSSAATTAPVTPEAAASAKAVACGNDGPYIPAPQGSGRAPELPEVPTLPQRPTKIGDAFTVFGATHALRSRFGAPEVTGREITIVGYIVDENMRGAPPCALHRTGKADPDDCKPALPWFLLADAKDATTGIRVMGWARNFAVLFDANAAYAKGKPAQPVHDDVFAIDVPYPLPAVGAKVKVTGTLGFSFTKSSTGMTFDPQNGLLTYARLETLEPAPRPAHLGR